RANCRHPPRHVWRPTAAACAARISTRWPCSSPASIRKGMTMTREPMTRSAFTGLLLAALLWTQPLRAEDATGALHALFAEEWARTLRESPEMASYLGDSRYNDRWDDVSPDAIERRHAADRAVLERLAAIDRAALSAAERLNYDLFRYQYAQRIEGHAHAQ